MIGDVGQGVLDSCAQGAGMAAVSGLAHKLGRLTGTRLGEAGGVRSAGAGGGPPQPAPTPRMWVPRALLKISGALRGAAPAPQPLQGMAGKFSVAITGSGWGLGLRRKSRRNAHGGRAGVRAQGGSGRLSTGFAGAGA